MLASYRIASQPCMWSGSIQQPAVLCVIYMMQTSAVSKNTSNRLEQQEKKYRYPAMHRWLVAEDTRQVA